jgi:hypothetical protein
VEQRQAFRVAAVLWAIYALITTLPVLGYPNLLPAAVFRAILGLIIAAVFWFRPGRGIAILGTVLGLASIPIAWLALTNLSRVAPLYIVLTVVALSTFAASAYSWWLTKRRA